MKKYFEDSISGDRKVLDGKELDIYIPSKKILIEYNGKQHYEFHKLFHKNNRRHKPAVIFMYFC